MNWKVLLIALSAGALAACNNQQTEEVTPRSAMQSEDAIFGDTEEHATWKDMYFGAVDGYENGRWEEALRLVEESYTFAKKHFGSLDATTLTSAGGLGYFYMEHERFDEAEPLIRESIDGFAKIYSPDHARTLENLNTLALFYERTDRAHLAEDIHLRVLQGRENKLGKDDLETLESVRDVGSFLAGQRRYGKAEAYYERALETALRTLEPGHGEIQTAYRNLGGLYVSQGRYTEAEDLIEEALAVERALPEKRPVGLGSVMNQLADIYERQGRHQEAVDLLREALELRLSVFERGHRAILNVQDNLAHALARVGEHDEAQALFEEVLNLALEVHGEEASITHVAKNNLALFYASYRNDHVKARKLLFESITGSEYLLGRQDPNLAANYANFGINIARRSRLRALAIYYIKKSVNLQAGVEQNVGLPSEVTTASFRKANSYKFARLQYRLFQTGRLSEAEYVGRLSKWRETDLTVNDEPLQIPLTPLEQSWEDALNALWETHGIDSVGASLAVYEEKVRALTRTMWDVPDEEIQAGIDHLGTSLQTDLLEDLRQLGDDTAMLQLYPFSRVLHVLLMTPKNGLQHHSVAIESAKARAAITKARDNLGLFDLTRSGSRAGGPAGGIQQASLEDTKDSLRALNDILMPAEIRDMLETAGTKHLILNLQDHLRYAPFAALFDGEEYLIQNYKVTRFNWGNLNYAESEPLRRGVGFGTSEAKSGFAELPAVDVELEAIFRSDASDEGVIAGPEYRNTNFTRERLESVLKAPPPVVHIASHFDMLPGANSADSRLLLGDGSFLTLKELNASSDLSFEGVELLVLSACSTARSTEGAGIEVEGLGAIAQLHGAEAVMATLWNVSDASTAEFMKAFYSELAKPNVSKADALHHAQTRLLKSDYAHPYYWAPYILMGNWK